jgi:hypothetical protein
MPLNTELLKKVRDRIAEAPESYNQDVFIETCEASPCGAAACLAGETIIAAAPTIEEGIKTLKALDDDWMDADHDDLGRAAPARRAAQLLGLTLQESVAVFDPTAHEWPEPYATKFRRAKNRETEAQVAVAYLDECLERGGVIW